MFAAAFPAYAQVCSSPTVDTDGDGIPDIRDNCILVANPNQRDTSGSGIGNACNADLNHDGIVNATDVARFATALAAYNSTQHTYTANADFNGDGKINAADAAILAGYVGKEPGPSANVPSLSFSPLILNFKTPFIGVATSLPVTLKNTGCKPVQILGAALSGDTSFQFFPPTIFTINAGQSAVINVSFTPTTTNLVTANLSLSTNTGASPGAKVTVALIGAGVKPTAAQTPTLVAPTGVSFSTVSTGGAATQSLPISNTGTAPLVITGIQSNNSLITVNASLLGGFPITIPPGASVSIPVTLTAGSNAGPVSATLQIQSNDPLRANASVSPQAVVVPAPLVANNPVTGVQAFDGQTPITAANCASVTRTVTFGAGTNAGDQFQVVMTDATGTSVTSAVFPAPSAPGTQILTGINACGLADSSITTKVIYFSGGNAAPTFVGTPATKDTSNVLAPPTLTQPNAPYFTASNANICGTARASTTVTITGGASPVSTTLDAATTTFCMTVPLRANAQNTLIATAVDNIAAPPRPSASSIPLSVVQVDPAQLVIAQATSTPLSASQIAALVASGTINLTDPANYNVSIFTIVLTIGSFPVTVTQPVITPIIGGGGIGSGGGWTPTVIPTGIPAGQSCQSNCTQIFTIATPAGGPVIPGILIMDSTISTLKEFFQVTLAIQNTSSQFTLTDVASSLSLPAGALTAVTAGLGTSVGTLSPNSGNTLSLGAILPGSTGSGQFVIRGDAIGNYPVTVQYTGFITGTGILSGIPFNGGASTFVQVLGPPDLSVAVHYPKGSSGYDVIAGQQTTLTVDVTNTSARPALYPSITMVTGGNITLLDPATNLPVPLESQSLPNILPGATVSASFLAVSSAQGYVIACQGLSSSNLLVSVDINADAAAPCNIANTLPAAFLPPSPSAPPTVLGVSPSNGQGNQPVTTSVLAELTPLSACLTPDTFTNVVTAPIVVGNPAAGIQVTSADVATPGSFYMEELDAGGNPVRHVPVQLTAVTGAGGDRTVATLRLGLATPLSQYFLKSLTAYRVTLVGADQNGSAGGAVCNAGTQAPMAKTYQWIFNSALSCTNTTAPVASLGQPAAGSSAQAVNTPIIVNFTKGMNGSTFTVDPVNALNDGFSVYAGASTVGGEVSGGTLVAGSLALSNQGTTVTFIPAANLPYSTSIVVRLTGTLKDACGNALTTAANGVLLFTFQTAAAPTAPPAAPKVNALPTITNLSTIPVTGSAPVGSTVTVLGAAQMVKGATGSDGNFSLSIPLIINQKNSLSVTATDSAGNVSAVVTTDISGNPLAVQSDQTNPTVLATSPQPGAANVPVGSAISVTFSKAINVNTANTLNVQLTAGALAVGGTVTASGSALTFTPAAPLTTGTTYQLRVRAGGVSDLAGNTLAGDFLLSFSTGSTTPTLTSITPASAAPGTVNVTFTGTNLTIGPLSVVAGIPGITGTITSSSATTVTASVIILAGTTPGATTLGLNVGGQTVSLTFTVLPGASTLTSISPASGVVGSSFAVTFTGTNLATASGVVAGTAGITGTIVTASATSVTANVTIASAAATGATTLGLTLGTQTLSLPFTVTAAAPTLTTISPTSGATGSVFTATFTGTNLATASAVVAGTAGITGTIVTASATSVTASVAITATAATGATTLGLTVGTQTLSLPFTVTAAVPTLTSINPTSGATGSSFAVTFTGTNLAAANAVVAGVAGITGTIVTASATSVTANVTIASTAATGATTLGLTANGQTVSLPFTVTAPPATLTAITPASGSPGTFTVTFTGTNLGKATAVISGNVGVTGTVGTVTATSVSASVTIASTAVAGATTLGLNVGGQSVSLPFTVNPPAPTITALTPAAGEQGHTVLVQITGTNLSNPTSITVGTSGVTASVAAGGSATAQSATLVIAGTAAPGPVTLSLTNAAGTATATFTITAAPPLTASLSPSPLTLSTLSTTTLTVTLNDLAPTGGQAVNFTSTAGLVAFSPSSVTIAANQTTASVSVTSTATSGSDTITASGSALVSGTASVQVQPRGFSLNAGLVGLSRAAQGAITLTAPAPTGGATINLSVANPSLVSVAPAVVTIPAGQTTAAFTLTGGATIGATTLTANGAASGFAVVTAPLTVTNLQINLSAAQIVGFGQTATYQVQIAPNPAPAGGTVIALSSSNTGVANVTAASVTIPAGAFSANFTVQAAAAATGSATITATNPNFAQATSSVTVTAGLAIAEAAKLLSSTQVDSVDFQLTSGGFAYTAPAGGVTVGASSSDSTCVSLATTSVLVAAGQSFGSFPISYGNTAVLPCTATVTVSNALYGSASIPVTYQAGATLGSITLSTPPYGVGNGLQQPITVSLSTAAPVGGATVEVRSANAAMLLVSPSATAPGAPAANVTFAAGAATATVYVQGVQGGATGNVTVTATTPQYGTGSSTVAVVAPAISMSSQPTSTTTLSSPTVFYVYAGVLYGNGTALYPEAVSPSVTGGVTVTATSSTPSVGELQTGNTNAATGTAIIPAGAYYTGQAGANLTFVPLGIGTTTLSISAPGFTAAATNYGSASQVVTVGQPGITVSVGIASVQAGYYGVGTGLELNSGTITLAAPAPAGGATIQVTSSANALVSTSGTVVGSSSISVPIAAGASTATFWLQGISVGTATVSATDLSGTFTSSNSVNAAVVASGMSLSSQPTSTSTLSPPSVFYVYIGALYNNGTLLYPEAVSPTLTGGLSVTATSSTPSVGALQTGTTNAATGTAVIPAGAYYTGQAGANLTFVPLSNGTTTLSISAPGFTAAATNYGPASQVVTVGQPGITVGVGIASVQAGYYGVGTGLELNSGTITLAAPAPAGGVTIQVTSSANALVSTSGTAVGLSSINVPIAAGATTATFWLQGISVGTATVSAIDLSGAFAQSNSVSAAVVAPAISLSSAPTSTSTLSPPSVFYVYIGALYNNGTLLYPEAVSPTVAGGLKVTATSGTPSVGELQTGTTNAATGTAVIPVGAYYTGAGSSNLTFVPLSNGTTTLSIAAPGFTAAATNYGPASQVVTVGQPGMTVSVGIASVQTGYYGVGTGLEVPGTITLGAPAPAGGSTIAVTSSANALVSASGTVAGSSTVSVPVAAGATTATFWLQGISVGTATVSAADLSGAFAPASGVTAAVVVPAISLSSAPTSTSTLSPPSVFYVYVGALYGNGTALYPEAVSPTVTGGLTVTATSSAPSVGALQTGTTNAATGTAVIPAGTYYTGQAGANLTFVPLSNGTTTLSISAPGFAAAATNYGPASQVVTVGQPGITLQGGIQVGGGLQYPLTGTLQVGESGGLTVRVASSDATTLLVSPDAVTPGSPFIDVFVGSGATTFTYYVQGVGGAVGSPTVTVTAPAFSAGTQTVIVATPQLTFYTGLPSSESATSPDAPFEIATYVPGFTYENVSAGSSLVVTLSSTNPAVASLTTSSQSATSPVTVTIPAGAYTSAASVSAGGVALHAVAAGAVNIAATATGTKSATQGVTLN